MTLRHVFGISLLSLLLLLSKGMCEEKLIVQSTNYPLHYFAERLRTDAFDLHYIVDPEVDPAFWKPSREEVEAFQKADIVLTNGAKYEKWLAHVSLRSARIVDTSKGFSDSFIHVEGKAHQHGNGVVHSHAGTAFTTWIDFSQAAKQAEAIAERFKQARPGDADEIEKNRQSLLSDLASLDKEMKAFGTTWEKRPLMASHPIYQYFARAYGLEIEAIPWEPDMDLTGKDIADLKAILANHPARWMIWEDRPTEANIAALANLGVKSVVFAPCASRPESGDWLTMMRENLKNIQSLIAPGS